MEPIFLRILAMIAFVGSQPEQALFQNGIEAVPKGQREYQQLIAVADSRNPVLAPAISLAACLIVGEEIPRIANRAVVLAHASPATIANVRTPLTPGRHWPDVWLG